MRYPLLPPGEYILIQESVLSVSPPDLVSQGEPRFKHSTHVPYIG